MSGKRKIPLMGSLRYIPCRNVLPVLLMVFSLLACKTTGVSQDTPGENSTIVFRNETVFTVDIIRGSGGIDVCTVPPNESIALPNVFENTEQYFPRFTIPLIDSYSLTGMRALEKDFYYQMSNSAGMQEVVITTPNGIDDRNSYIVITNNSNAGGIQLEANGGIVPALYPKEARTINAKTSAVYTTNEKGILRLTPGNAEMEHVLFKPGYVYYFSTDGKTVSLTDARPLACIGEPTWSRKLNGSGLPVFAEYADRSIKVAIPVNNGVDFITLGAMGEEIHKKTDKGYENAELAAMLKIDENSYLFAGYGPSFPFLLKQKSNDETSWTMPFPRRMGGYELNTIIPKTGNIYLDAGAVNNSAYMREIEAGKNDPEWEFLVEDANKNWKTLQSAAYNVKNNTYIITGMYGVRDRRNGRQNAFIGLVEQSGTTGKIKKEIILNDSIGNQVLCDSSGNIYIAGQASRDGTGYAVVQKYNSDGIKLPWQQAEELGEDSVYRCAILDEENGQIVLGGTMNTADNGNGGTPFLQGIDMANGNELWREAISPVSKELNSVTGLQKAKSYGYIAALEGISGGEQIFIIARLNSRGKVVNHESY